MRSALRWLVPLSPHSRQRKLATRKAQSRWTRETKFCFAGGTVRFPRSRAIWSSVPVGFTTEDILQLPPTTFVHRACREGRRGGRQGGAGTSRTLGSPRGLYDPERKAEPRARRPRGDRETTAVSVRRSDNTTPGWGRVESSRARGGWRPRDPCFCACKLPYINAEHASN